MIASTLAEPSKENLACMEIWGGNDAINNALSVPGIDCFVHSRPYQDSAEGGDIHYISSCGGGKIVRFAVADVSGHGRSVAELSTALRRLMRKHINKLDQTRFVRALNREFGQAATVGKFATALLTTFFTPTHHLIVCNAGHPQPLIYRAATRRWQPLTHDMREVVDRVSNLPLGIIDPTEYHQFAVKLDKDDLVLIYTDALIEAKSPAGQELGMDGLLKIVSDLDVADLTTLSARILDAVTAWRAGAAPDDDETLILLHHNGAGPPRQSVGEMLNVAAKMLGLKKV